MIANPLERFHVVLRNWVEMAARWHGLRNLDAVCDFVMRDPDIAALWRQRPVQNKSSWNQSRSSSTMPPLILTAAAKNSGTSSST